jgi:hypothetical protein
MMQTYDGFICISTSAGCPPISSFEGGREGFENLPVFRIKGNTKTGGENDNCPAYAGQLEV